MIALHILLTLLAFYLLARVCDDYFVPSLELIARDLRMSQDVAGATLMAVGSSAPELFISLFAVLTASGENASVGAGTIVGSALFNLLVIIGASAVVRRIHVPWQAIARDLSFYAVSVLLLLWSFRDGRITLVEASCFVGVYALYIVAVFGWRRWFPYEDPPSEAVPQADALEDSGGGLWGAVTLPLRALLKLVFSISTHRWVVFTLSITVIAALSYLLVESGVALASELGVPKALVGLTILAVGTSIPDFLSSLIVARRGQGSMATANAVGSNIFDILFGLGVPWLVAMAVSGGGVVVVETQGLISSSIVLLVSILVLLALLAVRRWSLGRRAGWFLVVLYLGYIGYEIGEFLVSR